MTATAMTRGITMKQTTHRRRTRRAGVLVALAAVGVATTTSFGPAAVTSAAPPPRIGIVCTSKTGTNPTFDITTAAGYISLPDGNTTYMWGY
ncbi:MAG: hypothetical protein ABIR68_06595, partial [Ilumatobacteraceae bacterium]